MSIQMSHHRVAAVELDMDWIFKHDFQHTTSIHLTEMATTLLPKL
jgi:hypothetical protein